MLKLLNKHKSVLLIIIASVVLAINYTNQKNIENAKLMPEKLSQFINNYIQRPESHLTGEPAKLMFPEINNPEYVSAKDASVFLRDFDDVFFIKFDNKTYVYPASILAFHHIVNDTINKKAIAITLCLLSDSALTYSREIENKVLTLGVLGPLFYGNLVIYDKETDGTSNRFFRNNIKVLAPVKEISFYRNFYSKYNESTIGLNTLKNKVELDKRLPPYISGLGINIKDNYKFYSFDKIKKQKIINDNLGGWNLLIVYNKKYDNYRIFRRFINNRILTFEYKDDALIDKETSTVWNFDGEAVNGKLRGKKLEMPIYTQVFWFSWSSFFPQTEVMN